MDQTSVHTSEPKPKLWLCKLHGLEHGPITWEELQALAERGDLKASDLVRLMDDYRWITASQARYVEPDPIAAPAPLPPPVAESVAPVAQPVQAEVAAASPPAVVAPAMSANPSGVALLAMALALLGLFKLALPLGMLAVYLGTRSACALRHQRIGPGISLAVAAMIVGIIDVAFSLSVLLNRLQEMQLGVIMK